MHGHFARASSFDPAGRAIETPAGMNERLAEGAGGRRLEHDLLHEGLGADAGVEAFALVKRDLVGAAAVAPQADARLAVVAAGGPLVHAVAASLNMQ